MEYMSSQILQHPQDEIKSQIKHTFIRDKQ